MITFLICMAILGAVLSTLAVVAVHRLSTNRDRLDNQAPTHTQTGEAAR